MSAYRSGETMNRGPHKVYLGRLNWANPACQYAFPTAHAAQRFALGHKLRHQQRAVVVTDPTGRVSTMEITGLAS